MKMKNLPHEYLLTNYIIYKYIYIYIYIYICMSKGHSLHRNAIKQNKPSQPMMVKNFKNWLIIEFQNFIAEKKTLNDRNFKLSLNFNQQWKEELELKVYIV